jgi:phthiocerol/phenolphthiocerol synthesis type-I polyketide synthase E
MSTDRSSHVAVIGLACRMPGAGDPDTLWANLVAGVESISQLGPDELPPDAGLEEDGAPLIAACGVLPGAERFDAAFYGYSPLEASLLDPQQRVFLECTSEVLEDAGCDPGRYPGRIGVYAGSSETSYLEVLRSQRRRLAEVQDWQLRLATGLDFLTSRVAYKLGLRGPAVTIQTGCSTSLVAIHLAAQALLAGDCDLALAGGATVHVPLRLGYYVPGGVLSPDGHCRAFDARAQGTVGSNGVGLVALKRYEDALADGDLIRAVLVGSAINNDAADKIGFTAPSVEGQARVIRDALEVAGLDPASISYIEAHGTGTALGDPIEVAALTRALGDRTEPCLLGSIKTNLGHTDAAAGVAGFIKVVLALQHQKLPPSLHFESPNPHLQLERTMFRVNAALRDWDAPFPRRAGVSSLGIGGTNAHVLLEEAPSRRSPVWIPSQVAAGAMILMGRSEDLRFPACRPNSQRSPGSCFRPAAAGDSDACSSIRSLRSRAPSPSAHLQLLPLSAKDPAALREGAHKLAAHLEQRPELALPDVAWTLQTGRREHGLRRFVVCGEAARAAEALRELAPPEPREVRPREVVFLYPGHGGQRAGMARGLYETSEVFRETVDQCCDKLEPGLGSAVRSALLADPDDAGASAALRELVLGQLAVFVVECALTSLWGSLGVRPAAVVGHSLGALAAAAAAGVLSVPDALQLVLDRARLIGSLPEGAMLALPWAEAEVQPLCTGSIALAALNGPRQCTLAGPVQEIEALHARLLGSGAEARLLRIPRAGHSPAVEPILAPFRACVERTRRRPPERLWVSDLTGAPVQASEALDPDYWVRHVRSTVRFHDALSTLLDSPSRVLLEVGPGRTLTTLVRQRPDLGDHVVAASLPHPSDETSDVQTLLAAVGQLWSVGQPIDWRALHPEPRRKVPLPTYAFQRRPYLVTRDAPLLSPDEPTPVAPSLEEALTEPEQRVRQAFAQVLGLESVGLHENFFELGGDSLMASQLVKRLYRTFGVRVPLKAVFGAPTVSRLTRLVVGEPQESPHA